jgi:hypothetical protein
MPHTRETWVPDQENHWVSILPPPAISGSCFLVYRKRPVMLYWFYIGVHLKSSAALLTEDSNAKLQLKYDLFVLLKLSFENAPPLCISFLFKTLLRRAYVQNFQHHFFLIMHNSRTPCSTQNFSNKPWTPLCGRQQLRNVSESSADWPCMRQLVKWLKIRSMYVWDSNIIFPFVSTKGSPYKDVTRLPFMN